MFLTVLRVKELPLYGTHNYLSFLLEKRLKPLNFLKHLVQGNMAALLCCIAQTTPSIYYLGIYHFEWRLPSGFSALE